MGLPALLNHWQRHPPGRHPHLREGRRRPRDRDAQARDRHGVAVVAVLGIALGAGAAASAVYLVAIDDEPLLVAVAEALWAVAVDLALLAVMVAAPVVAAVRSRHASLRMAFGLLAALGLLIWSLWAWVDVVEAAFEA